MKKEQRQLRLESVWQHIRPHLDGWRVYWRGVQLVVAAAPLPAIASLALVVLFSVVPVMQVWLMKWLVDVLSAPLHLAGGQVSALDGSLLITLVVLYILTLLIPGGLEPLRNGLDATINERAVAEIDRRIMRAAARLVDLQRIEAPSFHDEVKLIRQSSYEVLQILGGLSLGPGTILTLGGLLLLLGQIHPVLPLALLLVGIPYLGRGAAWKERNTVRWPTIAAWHARWSITRASPWNRPLRTRCVSLGSATSSCNASASVAAKRWRKGSACACASLCRHWLSQLSRCWSWQGPFPIQFFRPAPVTSRLGISRCILARWGKRRIA